MCVAVSGRPPHWVETVRGGKKEERGGIFEREREKKTHSLETEIEGSRPENCSVVYCKLVHQTSADGRISFRLKQGVAEKGDS